MELTLENAQAAVAKHGTVFFDTDLNPVIPQVGEYFCEFDAAFGAEDDLYLRAELLVRYVGVTTRLIAGTAGVTEKPSHLVVEDGNERDREPYGIILVRQG